MRLRPVLLALCVASVTVVGCSDGDRKDRSLAGSTAVEGPSSPADPTSTVDDTTAPVVPEPLADQTPPPSINGLVVDGDTVWVASIAGNQVIQIDPATGAILTRVETPGAGPDDVTVGPDGAIYTTGFVNGEIGRISDGTYEVVSTIGPAVNPLGFAPDGSLYAATFADQGALYRVPLDGSEPEVVADNLVGINAFAITADGQILAPSTTVTNQRSNLLTIDPATGTVTTIAQDLPAVLASDLAPDGTWVILHNLTGEVRSVDLATGETSLLATAPNLPFDNLAHGADGTIYLSSFLRPEITIIDPDRSQRVQALGMS